MRSSRALSTLAVAATLAALLGTGGTTAVSAVPAQAPVQASFAAPGADDATSSTSGEARAAERLLRADADGGVRVATGSDAVAEFVGTRGAPVEAPAVPPTATPAQAAAQHLDRYAGLFGVDGPGADLAPTEVLSTAGGGHVVKFTQQVAGLPVVGGELAVSLDPAGDLQSVNGETTADVAAVAAPVKRETLAVRTAVSTTARAHGIDASVLTAASAGRWMYDPELIGSADPFGARPVWRVEVSDGAAVDQLVLVDTTTGAVVESVNQVAHANIRAVCDRGATSTDASDRPCVRPYARTNGQAASGVAAVDGAFTFAGHTWSLFNSLGRDLNGLIGHDAGDGRKIRLTVRLPGENAFWNGREAFFSRGFATDDVVAHELSHGVIERLSGLAYWYQSGAINESMADVFGEIVDQRNDGRRVRGRAWVMGEDTVVGAIRNMAQPNRPAGPQARPQPDRMRSPLYFAPPARTEPIPDDNGGVHINSGVGNKAAFLIADGGRFNGRRVRGIDQGDPDRPKTARLYLRALQMLTSGSDYADLGRVLPQACRALVRPTAITARDCVQVSRAVAATEMLRTPSRAAAPEAPRCPGRTTARRIFFDDLERPGRAVWTFGQLWGRYPRGNGRFFFEPYATSGRRSIFAENPNPFFGTAASGALTLRPLVRVPARGRTFLRFDHSRRFEFEAPPNGQVVFHDGGKVDVSTNRGRTWANAASLPWVNGPRQQIRSGTFTGFGGDSFGYVSSRADLSRFRGRAVRLRWTVTGDAVNSSVGWFLDDIEVYTCR
jgi:bacillolysin